MENCTPKIVVAGDVCVDWLRWHTPAADEGQSWELYEGSQWAAVPGGALLLAQLLRQADGVTVLAPRLGNHEAQSTGEILQSFAELEPYPAVHPGGKQRVYRIARFGGYACGAVAPMVLPIEGDDPAADLVVLDDAGNCFRHQPDFWPDALKDPAAQPLVVYKMARPLLEGELWTRLRQIDPERLVIVVNADHLRAFGADISRRLSWERTAKDLVWQMACNPRLTELANSRHLVVRLGLEGALHYSAGPERMISRLYFDPGQIEGGYGDSIPGEMQGLGDAFVAALAYALIYPVAREREGQWKEERLRMGILAGLHTARQLLERGYGLAGEAMYTGKEMRDHSTKVRAELKAFPQIKLLQPNSDSQVAHLGEVIVPNPIKPEPPDPDYWCILKDLQGAVLEDVAESLVRRGHMQALHKVPVAQFGALRTADRAEIEGLRTIRNLIEEYLAGESTRPLSIAVFGFPGSGKSFSVTEVAQSIAAGRKDAPLEFNLSQFRALEDLIRAFHLVRDKALEGIVPLVFFDEFDTQFDGELGWLKYFLAPMQDGKFRDGDSLHPIGKAIFVFAGGTHNSFQAFARMERPGAVAEPHAAATDRRFRDAKGPDFVSRLRGHVNILGPNPIDDNDATCVVRRAMLLRSLIERKARQILDSQGQARIDGGVLRALLRVMEYRHGARSMQAILEMSTLAGRHRWEKDALPPAEQLALHVDPEVFTRLMLREVLLSAAREKLGRAVHEHFRRTQQAIKSPDDPSMRPWEELDEGLRESNRQQADHIPVKLRRIGCGLRPVPSGQTPRSFQFTPDEVEIMAEMEHERWMIEKRLAGWVYGPKDPEHRITPYLVPWDELPREPVDVQQWDRNAVEAIPDVVALARFGVFRLGRG